MSLTERLVDLTLFWGAITLIFYAAHHAEKTAPARHQDDAEASNHAETRCNMNIPHPPTTTRSTTPAPRNTPPDIKRDNEIARLALACDERIRPIVWTLDMSEPWDAA
jgi:hypothetical protein